MRLFLTGILMSSLFIMSCGPLRPGVRSYDIEVTDDITFDKDHRLTFIEVLEDSRCPVGVACVSPGQALVSFEVVRNGDDVIDLSLGFSSDPSIVRDTVVFDEYHIELLEVLPVPVEGSQPKPDDYNIRVLVEKLP